MRASYFAAAFVLALGGVACASETRTVQHGQPLYCSIVGTTTRLLDGQSDGYPEVAVDADAETYCFWVGGHQVLLRDGTPNRDDLPTLAAMRLQGRTLPVLR